ncbi:hypothetical protein D9R08_12000 [Rhodophyticola porphyridii]|uniref:Uncharacterized protein n=2 Tax=Rhodophyticola porphyridii TaxID=1852017 RepID=A0A3L9XZX3_9RHOB|nr:hypothetical protein D9R08_12000 [Rhodophyticola porphyridii]
MRGEDVPRHDGDAYAGWFKRRLVEGGPWVPVRIFVEREIDADTGELAGPERLVMEVEGIRSDRDPADTFSWLTPISRAEHDRLTDMRLRDPRFFTSTDRIDLSEAPTLPPGVF